MAKLDKILARGALTYGYQGGENRLSAARDWYALELLQVIYLEFGKLYSISHIYVIGRRLGLRGQTIRRASYGIYRTWPRPLSDGQVRDLNEWFKNQRERAPRFLLYEDSQLTASAFRVGDAVFLPGSTVVITREEYERRSKPRTAGT